ncbi:unnamed protein product, partial [Musa textilis]
MLKPSPLLASEKIHQSQCKASICATFKTVQDVGEQQSLSSWMVSKQVPSKLSHTSQHSFCSNLLKVELLIHTVGRRENNLESLVLMNLFIDKNGPFSSRDFGRCGDFWNSGFLIIQL